jgi:hypothetical protein
MDAPQVLAESVLPLAVRSPFKNRLDALQNHLDGNPK